MRIREKTGQRSSYFHDVGNGEFFVGYSGVTFSDPRIANAMEDRFGFSEVSTDIPWFEQRSEQVVDMMNDSPALLLEGDLGAGKSTVVYGVRTLLRQAGVPYMHIDGHYTNRAERIASAIASANSHDRTIIYDSFDYLFLRRGVNQHSQLARAAILPLLRDFKESGGNLLMTSHTKPWLEKKSSPELVGEMEAFVGDTQTARVYGYFESEEELVKVCDLVFASGTGERYFKKAVCSSESTAMSYRVMKLIIKQHGIDSLESMSMEEFDERVRNIDATTRLKSGASDDYSFVPER